MGADEASAAAEEMLTDWLANRGDADNETFAREFIAALQGAGWRPPLPVRTAPRRRGRPPTAEYLAAKAALFGPQSDAKDGAA